MMIVQYLLDADESVTIPGVEAPLTSFGDVVEPVRLALEQEKSHRADQGAHAARPVRGRPRRGTVPALVPAGAARGGLVDERLLTVVERSQENVMLIEDYLTRESGGESALEAPACGGWGLQLIAGRASAEADALRAKI